MSNALCVKKDMFFSIFLSLLPILGIYGVGINGISLGELLLVLFFIYGVLTGELKISEGTRPLIVFVIYIFSIALFNAFLFNYSQINSVLIRSIRISFYMATIAFFESRIDKKIIIKSVLIISFTASVFMIVQNFLYSLFDIKISGLIPNMPIYTELYMSKEYKNVIEEKVVLRFTSFFLEPAHFSRYVILGLILALYEYKGRVKTVIALVLTVAIVLSGSGNGYMMLIIVWSFFMFDFLKNRKFTMMQMCLAIVVAIASFYFLSKSNIVNYAWGRIFDGASTGNSNAVNARLGTYSVFGEENIYFLIFGNGWGCVPFDNAWMSDVVYCLWGSGIVGVTIVMTFLTKCFSRTKNKAVKVMFFVFIMLFATDDVFKTYGIVLNYSLLALLSFDDVRRNLNQSGTISKSECEERL